MSVALSRDNRTLRHLLSRTTAELYQQYSLDVTRLKKVTRNTLRIHIKLNEYQQQGIVHQITQALIAYISNAEQALAKLTPWIRSHPLTIFVLYDLHLPKHIEDCNDSQILTPPSMPCPLYFYYFSCTVVESIKHSVQPMTVNDAIGLSCTCQS